MKKRKKGKKLNRERSQRKALRISLAESLFLNRKIKTTEAKAKEARVFVEKSITRAKKGNKKDLKSLFRDEVVSTLMELADEYKDRNGGYTRIIKLAPRLSDGAKMAILELV